MNDVLAYMPAMVGKIVANFWVKLMSALGFVSVSFFFDSLHTQALTALFFLIIIDFIFGIIAAYKTGIEIKSAKILRSALKTVVYFVLVSAAFMAESAGLGYLPLDETIIAFLAATELISLIENTANMGFAVPKKLLNKLKSFTSTK